MTRLLYGNLDAELGWGPPDLRELPAPVRAMLSAAATTMTAFARPGDTLWLPSAVDAERLPTLPGIERPMLVTGTPPTAQLVLPWGTTTAVEALRGDSEATQQDHVAPDASWIDLLWRTPSDPTAASRVNHRTFAAALCHARGIALPGSRVVHTIEELETHLGAGGTDAGYHNRWVIKAPHSASGRLRLRQQGQHIEPTARVRAQRLFARYGSLVFEPWVDRVADYGCVGIVTTSGHRLFAPHLLNCDASGVFRALTIDDDGPATTLDPGHRTLLDETVNAVADAIAAAGYRGPFGIDAYLYRDKAGHLQLHPLSEINARISFGHVGRALAQRCFDGRGTLRLGGDATPHGTDVVPVLLPGARDATSVWLTR